MIARLTSRSAFGRLRLEGTTTRSGPLRLRRLHPSDEPQIRVGYRIGRSVGSAVVRNRLRRRIRHLVAALERDGTLAPGWYVISCHPSSAILTTEELRQHLQRLFKL